MKLLLDFLPIAVFFAAFKIWDIYTATGVAIAATVLQLIVVRVVYGKIEPMAWLSLGVIVVFGGATILSHSETFIKWKPTVLYWLMGTTLAAGQLLFRKNLIKSLMGAQMQLPDRIWRGVNWSWVGFFALMGALNLWVAFNFPTETWVNFKLFGGMGLMAMFVVVQAVWLSRHMTTEPAAASDPP